MSKTVVLVRHGAVDRRLAHGPHGAHHQQGGEARGHHFWCCCCWSRRRASTRSAGVPAIVCWCWCCAGATTRAAVELKQTIRRVNEGLNEACNIIVEVPLVASG